MPASLQTLRNTQGVRSVNSFSHRPIDGSPEQLSHGRFYVILPDPRIWVRRYSNTSAFSLRLPLDVPQQHLSQFCFGALPDIPLVKAVLPNRPRRLCAKSKLEPLTRAELWLDSGSNKFLVLRQVR